MPFNFKVFFKVASAAETKNAKGYECQSIQVILTQNVITLLEEVGFRKA